MQFHSSNFTHPTALLSPTWLAMLRLIVPKMKGFPLPSGSPQLRNDLFQIVSLKHKNVQQLVRLVSRLSQQFFDPSIGLRRC